MTGSRYPRMLFRGDETSRADSRDELLVKRAQGWRATLLPGETPADIGETEETHVTRESVARGASAGSAPELGRDGSAQEEAEAPQAEAAAESEVASRQDPDPPKNVKPRKSKG